MRMKRTEFLAAVAIITSATVLQIREHMQPHDLPSARAQTASTCGLKLDGLVPAACESAREKRQVDRAPEPQHTASPMWV